MKYAKVNFIILIVVLILTTWWLKSALDEPMDIHIPAYTPKIHVESKESSQAQPGDIMTVVVGPHRVPCVGLVEQDCLVVDGELFYDSIEGFAFKEGITSTIVIERKERMEPIPADASSFSYHLIEILKEHKEDIEISLDLLVGTWQWKHTQYNNNEEIAPRETNDFTITFNNDGTLSGTTDCNNYFGSYTYKKGAISIGSLGMTLKYCEGAQESIFLEMLQETHRAFLSKPGELSLLLPFDTGSIVFMRLDENYFTRF